MKHAKKLLAVVMVLAMIGAFSAIAFAAPAATFTVGNYADGKATVTVNLDGAVGLTSGSLAFSYPDGKVTKIIKKNGADVAAIGDIDNAFSSEFNNTANPAEFGFYFKNNLWSSAEWKSAADDLDQTNYVNGESFEAAQFVFTAEAGTTVTVTGELKIGDAVTAVNTSFTLGAVEPTEPASQEPASQEPASQEPASQEPASQEPATQEPVTDSNAKYDKYGNKILGYDKNGQAIIGYNKKTGLPIYSQDRNAHKAIIPDVNPNDKGNDFVGDKNSTAKAGDKDSNGTTAKAGKTTANVKTDAGKNTGDNSVLAIVAGVNALAGAAYVVTKKRK